MFVLNQHSSIANHFLADLRDVSRQSDRLRFRKSMERLGEILAYEISKKLVYRPKTITTPLDNTTIPLITDMPVVISVMRAAIPFYQGIINFFDQSDSGFIGAYRKEHKNETHIVEIDLSYIAAPSIEGKEVLVVDPMLATGKSFVKSVENLLKHGKPARVHIVSIIAAPEGIEYLQNMLTVPYQLWLCAIDQKLNAKSYIVPGLGDAGDLAFGNKL